MNIFDLITQLILNQQSALVAGFVAGLTPCTLALIPLFLYRFGIWRSEGKQQSILWKDLLLLLIGFLASFFVTGLVFQSLFASDFVNILRLVLGSLLVFAGLALFGRSLSLQFFAQVTHPLALGAVMPWVLSFSPCVLPWLAVVLVNNGSLLQPNILGKFLLFGAGMLIPALIVAILGRIAWRSAQKLSRALHVIERITPLLLIFAGFYLSVQLLNLTSRDVAWSGAILTGIIIVYAFSIFRIPARRTILNIQIFVVLLVLAVIFTVIGIQTALPHEMYLSGQALLQLCLPGENNISPVAFQEAALFNLLGAGLGVWSWVANRAGMQVRFVME